MHPGPFSRLRRAPRRALGRLVVTLLFAFPAAAAAAVFNGFDADFEYWRANGTTLSDWLSSDGNPGGTLALPPQAPGWPRYLIAPPAWLGDWRGMTTADSLSCDLWYNANSAEPPAYLFRISGPGGAATALAGLVPPWQVWTRAAVAMDPALWQVESGTWEALLAHVNSVQLEVTNYVNMGQLRVDNLCLTGAVTPVTRDCESEHFNAYGLGDWAVSGVDVVDNPGTGGNTYGHLYTTNLVGLAWAYAPGQFLGDWSALAENSRIAFDLRIHHASGVRFTSIPEFVQLSGPGGTAAFALQPAELPAPGRLWKRFQVPIQPSAWTVTSGTWAGLLANVSECRIQIEYYGGGEAIGLDNFAREGPGCPAIDERLTLHVSDVSLTGWTGFQGVASVAQDSVSGALAGTVDETLANGGGLYAVTGPQAGTRLQAYDRPVHVIFDANGYAFVSEDQAGVVNRFVPGIGTAVWASGFQAGDDDPSGMCFAPPEFDGTNVDPGDLLVVDWGGYDSPDGVWSFKTWAIESELRVMGDPGSVDMHDIAPGPLGEVILFDALNGSTIYLLDAEGHLHPTTLAESRLGVVSVVFDPTRERAYIADTGSLSLSVIDFTAPQWRPTTVATGFNSFAPCCLEIDVPGRRLWVTDAGVGRVYEFRLDANVGVEDRGPAAGAPGLRSLRAWPNPVRSATSVQLVLARGSEVRVDVIDTAGRLVRRLADERLEAGAATFAWDGRDSRGLAVPPGVYLVSARAGEDTRATRVVVLR